MIGVIKGDTRSLDYGSYELLSRIRVTEGPSRVDIGVPLVVYYHPEKLSY